MWSSYGKIKRKRAEADPPEEARLTLRVVCRLSASQDLDDPGYDTAEVLGYHVADLVTYHGNVRHFHNISFRELRVWWHALGVALCIGYYVENAWI